MGSRVSLAETETGNRKPETGNRKPKLQCSNDLSLSSLCENTVPIYSNIWTWWYDMLIL